MLRRPRRNRKTEVIRAMVRETALDVEHLVYPLFLVDGNNIKDELSSLPGNYRLSADKAIEQIAECRDFGLNSFILFPAVADRLKDKKGTYGSEPDNFYLQAAKRIKEQFAQVCLISDVALDPYNSDGHDGFVKNGEVDNDLSLPLLAKMALAQAQAGFDILGPSDMMDGRVQLIRETLDEHGFYHTGIMSYTAKYASAYYGPFRDALDSAPVEAEDIPKDKKTYQMDPANKAEALIEAELDTQEGADYLMVKPAINYLDVIHLLKNNFDLPIAAYHVSGECAMLTAACQRGWLDYKTAMPETLTSIRRAGADVIISYFAKDFARMKIGGEL